MLVDSIDDPAGTPPEALCERYEAALADVIDSVGADAVVEGTGLDEVTVDSIESGDAADLDLREAAEVLALPEGSPDAAAILAEVRDHLLLAMSTAMLDVDRIAADVEGGMDAKEVQGKVEGRHPMTLSEYARIHHYVAAADGR